MNTLIQSSVVRKLLGFCFMLVSGLGIAPLAGSATDGAGSQGIISTAGQGDFAGTLPSWASQGAELIVYSWPNLTGSQVGQTFQIPQVINQQVSGAHFSVPLALSTDTNYQFVIQTSSETATVMVSGSGGSSTVTPGPVGLSAHERRQKNLPLVQLPPFYIVSNGNSLASLPTGSSTSQNGSDLRPNLTIYPNGCTATETSYIGTELVNVGEAHTATTVTGTFTYGSDSSSSIGIGISPSGTYGSFSSGGTYSQLSGSTSPIAISAGQHVKIAGQFYDGKFAEYCGPKGEFMGILEIPYQFDGLLYSHGSASTNPWGSCPSPPAMIVQVGHSQTIYFGSSVTYSSQVSLMGFTFSESSTWGSVTSMHWDANSGSGTTYLCGPYQSNPNGASIVYDSL
jgi:hypothetical protein